MANPDIKDVPAGAMQFAERAGKAILGAVKKMFQMAFGAEYTMIIIAVRHDDKGSEDYAILSDLDGPPDMVRVMNEAARRTASGTMCTNHDHLEPKH